MTTTTTVAPSDLKAPTLIPGSTFPMLHKTSGPLRAALETLPEWVDALADLVHLDSIRPPQRNPASLDLEVEVLLTECVDNRAPLDLDAVTNLASVTQDRIAAHVALTRGFETAASVYARRMDDAVRENQEVLYDHLTREVIAVVDKARAIADAFTLDAAGAIAADQVTEWQQTGSLRSAFRSVHQTRRMLLKGLSPNRPAGYAELEWISNPAEVFDHWRAWRNDGALVNPRNPQDRKPLRSPWPDPHELRGEGAENAWFDYIVATPEAAPWAPSPAQVSEAASELGAFQSGQRTVRPARRWVESTPPPEYVEDTKPRKARAS